MGCGVSKEPTDQRGPALPPQFKYEAPREIGYAKIRKHASFFAHIDTANGPDGGPTKILIFGRSRGGFNLKMMYAVEPSTGKIWKFDFSSVEEHIDAVSVYTVVTDSLARGSAELFFRLSSGLASDSSMRSSAASSAAPTPSSQGSSGSFRLCVRFLLGACDPGQLVVTDPGSWPSVVSLSADHRILTVQFALLKLYSPTWRDIWMEYVICLNDAAPKLRPTILEETQPAHETIIIQSDAGENIETRRRAETAEDRQHRSSRSKVEHHIRLIEKEIARLRALTVDLRHRVDKGEVFEQLPDIYEGYVKSNDRRSAAAERSSSPTDNDDYPDEPSSRSNFSDASTEAEEFSAAPGSEENQEDQGMQDSRPAVEEKSVQKPVVVEAAAPVAVPVAAPPAQTAPAPAAAPVQIVTPASDVRSPPVTPAPSTAVAEGKFNRWRNLDGSVIARRYGYDTALPIVRVLTLLEDVRLKLEANPSLLEDAQLRIEDLLYVEDVLAKNRQFNPEFIAQAVTKSAKDADEETGQFLVNELAPYQRSAMQTLGTSLAVVRSVLAFKSKLRRSLGQQVRKVVTFSVLDFFPKLGPFIEQTNRWDFDIFAFHRNTLGRPLFAMTVHFIEKYELVTKLNLDVEKLGSFLRDMEEHYLNNPYHNRIHGSDVLQTMMYFLETGGYVQHLTAVDILAVIIATSGHDLGHPGLANPFQIRTMSPLALRFNNQSVLEMFHCSFLFELLMKEPNNFISALDFESKLSFRDLVISLILATDMGRNFEYLGKFQTTLIRTDRSKFAPANPDELKLMLQLFIKAADVSNPAKPANVYLLWVDRVMEEFYRQGDRERQLGLPISPFMNRETTDVGKCQVGFMDFITLPLYECLANFDSVFLPALQQLITNKNFWNDMVKQGFVQRELAKIKGMAAEQQAMYVEHERKERAARAAAAAAAPGGPAPSPTATTTTLVPPAALAPAPAPVATGAALSVPSPSSSVSSPVPSN